MQVDVDPTEALKRYLHGEIQAANAELQPKLDMLRAKIDGYEQEGRYERADNLKAEMMIVLSERELALQPIREHLRVMAIRAAEFAPPPKYFISPDTASSA